MSGFDGHVMRLLRFLADKQNHKAGYYQHGRLAYGPPEDWTHFEIAGHKSRVRVPVAVWAHVCNLNFVATCPSDSQMFGLTYKGRDALAGRAT